MKKAIPFLAAAALLVATGQDAEAQLGVDFGPQLSYNAETEDFGLGARLEVSPALLPLAFFGSGDYYFVDCPSGADCSFLDFAAGVKYTIALPGSPIGPYFGAGLTHQRMNVEGIKFDDTGFNVVGGIGLGGFLPVGAFAEGRYLLMNDFENQFAISFGVLF